MHSGRRLGGLLLVGAGLLVLSLLAGCAPAAQPSPTQAPAKLAPTTAPAKLAEQPAAKPAAEKPPEKPAGQPAIKMTTGTLAFPSLVAPVVAIIKSKDLAKKHGIDLEIKAYSQIPAFYGALTTGEVNTLVAGPHVLQRMRIDRAPIQAISTYARLDALQLLTADPSIKGLSDLRGKKIAADMSSSEFQVLAVYAKSKGINLNNDATVVQAALPLARQQLKTGEVDAGMLWEPAVTQALREDNKDYRSIFEGQKAWEEMTNTEGWELVAVVRDDYAKSNPEAITRWIATLKEATDFIKQNIDEADAIVAQEVKLPAGIFKEAVQSGRMVYSIQPAWEEKPRKALEQMFKVAVDVGYIDKMPPDDVIYRP